MIQRKINSNFNYLFYVVNIKPKTSLTRRLRSILLPALMTAQSGSTCMYPWFSIIYRDLEKYQDFVHGSNRLH